MHDVEFSYSDIIVVLVNIGGFDIRRMILDNKHSCDILSIKRSMEKVINLGELKY